MVLNRAALRLCLVTDPELCRARGLVETVLAAVAGGATMVQLRDKTATARARIEAARALKLALAGTGVPLIVNDDIDAALAVGAEGVHIGQEDCDPTQARALLGPGPILGLSCETLAAVRAADPGVVDYLGLGPVFGTASKPDHKRPVGFDGLAALRDATRLPTIAIGGLKAEHVGAARDAGVDGLAVISAICGRPDPEAAARAFSWETPT